MATHVPTYPCMYPSARLQAGCLSPGQCAAAEAKLQATLQALATLRADARRVGLGPEVDPELDAFMVSWLCIPTCRTYNTHAGSVPKARAWCFARMQNGIRAGGVGAHVVNCLAQPACSLLGARPVVCSMHTCCAYSAQAGPGSSSAIEKSVRAVNGPSVRLSKHAGAVQDKYGSMTEAYRSELTAFFQDLDADVRDFTEKVFLTQRRRLDLSLAARGHVNVNPI